VVIDDGVNNSFSRIDDGVVAVFDGVVAVFIVRRIDGVVVVLVVRRIDGVVVKNDKTDPDGPDDPDGNAAAAAVDCAAVESKGGAVAELVARNASNPGNRGRLAARMVASP